MRKLFGFYNIKSAMSFPGFRSPEFKSTITADIPFVVSVAVFPAVNGARVVAVACLPPGVGARVTVMDHGPQGPITIH